MFWSTHIDPKWNRTNQKRKTKRLCFDLFVEASSDLWIRCCFNLRPLELIDVVVVVHENEGNITRQDRNSIESKRAYKSVGMHLIPCQTHRQKMFACAPMMSLTAMRRSHCVMHSLRLSRVANHENYILNKYCFRLAIFPRFHFHFHRFFPRSFPLFSVNHSFFSGQLWIDVDYCDAKK